MMSNPIGDADQQIIEVFRASLASAWNKQRQQEQEISQTYLPLSEKVAQLLQSIAGTVTEVTGQPATVGEIKPSIYPSRQSMVLHHTIHHPSGDLHVKVHCGLNGIEYHRERLDLSQEDALLALIVRNALVHFGPKPA
jgi:hypothetical protein